LPFAWSASVSRVSGSRNVFTARSAAAPATRASTWTKVSTPKDQSSYHSLLGSNGGISVDLAMYSSPFLSEMVTVNVADSLEPRSYSPRAHDMTACCTGLRYCLELLPR